MKHIFKWMLLPAMILPLVFTSCNDDRDSNPTLDLSHVNEKFVLNTPANAANNTYDLLSSDYIVLTTQQPNYGGAPYPVRYYVQVSLTDNFEDEDEFLELTTSYVNAKMNVDASELNQAMVALYQKGNTDLMMPETTPVFLRLRAVIDGTDNMGESYSNSIKLPNVRAVFVPDPATLPDFVYVQGPAINGGEAKAAANIYGIKSTNTNSYYTVVYLPDGGTMTWGPATDDMRGFSRLTSVDDAAGAGVTAGDDDVLTFAKGGWYTLVFDDEIQSDKVTSLFTLHVYETHAFVTGHAAGETWAPASEADWELTAPADNTGEWVSPPFTTAGELRAYVKIPGISDWWRSEFTVVNGNVTWRLVNIIDTWKELGDDYLVNCAIGQRLYVNFDTNKARVE